MSKKESKKNKKQEITELQQTRPTLKGVYVAVLNQGWIRPELVKILLELSRQGGYRLAVTFPADKPISNNRNKIVRNFLSTDFDYLMMIDGDNIPPSNILALADFEKDIIGGLCFAQRYDNKRPVYIPLILNRTKDEKTLEKYSESQRKYRYTPVELNGTEGLMEVDAIGTGCIIMSRKVLEEPTMEYPFKNLYDENGEKLIGLDLYFCRRAKELGYKVYCHTDYPIGHWSDQNLKMVYGSLRALIDENKHLQKQIQSSESNNNINKNEDNGK